MNRYPQIGKAARVGGGLGRACRKLLRHERRLWSWLCAKRVPEPIVVLLSWVIRGALIATLLYISFWILLAVAALAVFSRLPVSGVQILREHEDDHRLSGFYDPINYNDDPDPRFEGE